MSRPSYTAYYEACLAHFGPSDNMNAAYCSQMDLFVEEHSCEVGIEGLNQDYFGSFKILCFLGLQKD